MNAARRSCGPNGFDSECRSAQKVEKVQSNSKNDERNRCMQVERALGEQKRSADDEERERLCLMMKLQSLINYIQHLSKHVPYDIFLYFSVSCARLCCYCFFRHVSCRLSFVSLPFPFELMTTIHATRRKTVDEKGKKNKNEKE